MYSELTLKQKDQIVKKMYKNYKRAQLDLIYLNQHYNYYPSVDIFKVRDSSSQYSDQQMLDRIDKKEYLEEYVYLLEQIHTHLSKESFVFIENEYINFYDTNWWIPVYSKATYYRMKHKALDEFLEYLLIFWDEEEILRLLI